MKLLSEEVLERSAVVANCRMNRERGLAGSNGYDRELGFNPIDLLVERLGHRERVAWLDLCCGTGRALIESAGRLQAEGMASRAEILGVDLVGMFHRPPPGPAGLRLVEASLRAWQPGRAYDLITCVHGLHYVGDKLGLIARAASWLVDDGLLVAHLDVANLRTADGRCAGRRAAAELRRGGLEYDRRRHLLTCRGKTLLRLYCRYLGADERAGPNYTGQPAVNSHYGFERSDSSCRLGNP